MRKPIIGELVSMERDCGGNIGTKVVFGMVLPAKKKWQFKGYDWCVFWFDLGYEGADFSVETAEWKKWTKYIEE